jgi:hypothetical protein
VKPNPRKHLHRVQPLLVASLLLTAASPAAAFVAAQFLTGTFGYRAD